MALKCFGYFDEWRNKQFLKLETVGVLLDDVKEGSSDWIKNDYEINKFFFWQGAAKAAEKAGMDDKEAAEELDALTKKISEKEVDSKGNLKKAGKNCAKNVGKNGKMSMKDFQEKILDEFAGKDFKATDMGMGGWGLQYQLIKNDWTKWSSKSTDDFVKGMTAEGSSLRNGYLPAKPEPAADAADTAAAGTTDASTAATGTAAADTTAAGTTTTPTAAGTTAATTTPATGTTAADTTTAGTTTTPTAATTTTPTAATTTTGTTAGTTTPAASTTTTTPTAATTTTPTSA